MGPVACEQGQALQAEQPVTCEVESTALVGVHVADGDVGKAFGDFAQSQLHSVGARLVQLRLVHHQTVDLPFLCRETTPQSGE